MCALHVHPCLDTEEMAALRRQELDIAPHLASQLGWSAVEAMQSGYYSTSDGRRVDWRDQVAEARGGKISIPPDAILPTHQREAFLETRVQVSNETTLGASYRFRESGLRPLALNFANGIHPGGGFLGGDRAQEESLCRSSALYETLSGDAMYAAHRGRPLPDSTAWAIYSPRVPVFRRDSGETLNECWFLSFISCAAPYAPRVGGVESARLLQQRIHRILEIASSHGYTALVLGAFGCGAFRNDPQRTARDFRHALEHDFRGAFSDVVFAITDWSPERRFLGPFRDVFAA